MKSVLVIIALLSLAHYAMASSCSAIPQYTAYLKPACAANDTSIFWPNYENFTQYYRCRGVGNPVLTDCLVDTYFSFPLQICTPCDRFLPAPACEHLSTENPAVCLPIQSSTIATPTAAPNSPTTPSTPAATENPNIPRYNTTFIPACEANDVDLLWPNYENFSEYYKCQKVGTPVIGHCAADNYFSFYWQVCTTIDKFLPAPLCENLSTQSPPVCVPIGSTTLAPTDAPTDAPTAAPTDVPTVAPTNAPTAAPTNAPTAAPTNAPTAAPTDAPTAAPTNAPTAAPTEAPTAAPTDAPTAAPTESVNTPPPNIPTPPVIG